MPVIGKVAHLATLHGAASTARRTAFLTINRATGHRVRRQFLEANTGRPVLPRIRSRAVSCPTAAMPCGTSITTHSRRKGTSRAMQAVPVAGMAAR